MKNIILLLNGIFYLTLQGQVNLKLKDTLSISALASENISAASASEVFIVSTGDGWVYYYSERECKHMYWFQNIINDIHISDNGRNYLVALNSGNTCLVSIYKDSFEYKYIEGTPGASRVKFISDSSFIVTIPNKILVYNYKDSNITLINQIESGLRIILEISYDNDWLFVSDGNSVVVAKNITSKSSQIHKVIQS